MLSALTDGLFASRWAGRSVLRLWVSAKTAGSVEHIVSVGSAEGCHGFDLALALETGAYLPRRLIRREGSLVS